MQYIHISGEFVDKINACKFCKSFFLWGTCYGHCMKLNDDVHCNDTCEKFDKDTDTFDENNAFVSEEAREDYYC